MRGINLVSAAVVVTPVQHVDLCDVRPAEHLPLPKIAVAVRVVEVDGGAGRVHGEGVGVVVHHGVAVVGGAQVVDLALAVALEVEAVAGGDVAVVHGDVVVTVLARLLVPKAWRNVLRNFLSTHISRAATKTYPARA